MKKDKVQISIIIVNYKVEKELIDCISSIINSKPKTSFEIIVADNSENNDLRLKLKIFPQVKYVKSKGNIGFGAGNNLGAKSAKGDVLFFLNPDTIIEKNAIDDLFNFINKNSKAGMVAPLLLDLSGNSYPNQGSDQYDFKSAIVTSSFINRLFPKNPISKKFFHKDWVKKEIEEFDVVPGTAFMIKKSIFEKSGMYDEKFFLYFEEYDLANRIKKAGFKNYIVPQAKVMHIWEASAKKRKDINRIFSESRNHFFKKNYGRLFAFMVNLFSNIGKYELLLGLTVATSVYLCFSKIAELMPFIGDQGWFYLSARDMIVNGQIPFVGIASSHPWLHQGAFWTYLLAPFLWLFNFNPVAGAYLSIILGILSTIGIYILGVTLFSKRAGIIASILYTTSPLAVYYMRFPYHTSPIPLFIIMLIFSLYKITQNKMRYFPLTIFLLAILYNFEISTVILWGVLLSILTYKFFKQRKVFNKIFNKKIMLWSFLALITPLLPMILYDVRNGFPQTLKFMAWVLYKGASLFGFNTQHDFSINKILIMFDFLFVNFKKLIFAQNNLISLLILVVVVSWGVYVLFKKNDVSYKLIPLLFFIPLIFIVLNQVPSDAYLPTFFPVVILIFATFLDFVMNKRVMILPILIFLTFLIAGNINFMLKNDFLFDKSSKLFTLEKRIHAVHRILNIANNKDYNLKGRGPGSEHESFTMNYEYLAWRMGHAPSKENESTKIYISESEHGIKIETKNK
ncbi:MAG: glycosyltransferase [Candidatus Levybacteria bacterium]|nr:glycosyltransferase [Candidatus Levybacteria bacterium]